MGYKLILFVMLYFTLKLSYAQNITYLNVTNNLNLSVKGNNYLTMLFSTPDNAPYRLYFINDTTTSENYTCAAVYVDNNSTNIQMVQMLQLIFLLGKNSAYTIDGYISNNPHYCHILEIQINNT